MKTLDSGALVKEYETLEKETEQAVQMIVTSVTSEDPRYVERMSLPLSEEFPIGTNLFFLGDKAYGAFARISGTTDTSLSVILTVSSISHHMLFLGCDRFDISTFRKTETGTKGSERLSGRKSARGITPFSKFRRWLGSRRG